MASFDIDMFYLLMASSWVSHPKEREFIDNLYQTQKIRFYNKAKVNPLYDYALMQDRPIETEVTMRRAFGILLCSQDDEELQDSIIEELYKMFPQIKRICAGFSFKNYMIQAQKYGKLGAEKNLSSDEINMFIWAVAYIIYCKHGFDINDADIERLYQSTAETIADLCVQSTDNMRRVIESIKPKELMIIPRELRKLQESILNGKDISDCVDIFQVMCEPVRAQVIPMNSLSIKHKLNLIKAIDENDDDVYSALSSLGIMALQFQFQGLSYSSYFDGVEFSKEERDTALKIVARMLDEVYHDSKQPYLFRFDYYMQALVLGKIAKFIKETKEFYFANNRETQYNELEKALSANAALQEENDQLNRTLQDKDLTINALQDQVHALSMDLSEGTKEIQGPLTDAIAILQSHVISLQEELETEREKNAELNRLREFVFSIQSGVDIEEAKTPLKDLIAGKKIYIIGGHINWRNKMKSTYPSLILLDGHQESLDEKILLGADMVLLNTGNMSHTVYYKVIDVLRKNKIPFDYIGKTLNTELLEHEIAEILQHK